MIPRPDIENTRSLYASFEDAEPYEYYRKAMALAEEIPALLAYIDALEAAAVVCEDAIRYTQQWMSAPLNIEGHKEAARRLADALKAIETEGDE